MLGLSLPVAMFKMFKQSIAKLFALIVEAAPHTIINQFSKITVSNKHKLVYQIIFFHQFDVFHLSFVHTSLLVLPGLHYCDVQRVIAIGVR